MTNAAPPPPVKLEYSPEDRSRRRRRVRRGIVLACLILAGTSIFRERHRVATAVARVYWARQCMSFTAPPAQLLAEHDTDAAVKLVGRRESDYLAHLPIYSIGFTHAILRPRCLRELQETERDSASRVANSGGGVAVPFTPAAYNGSPTLFLHGRTSPNGHRRLVHVKLARTPSVSQIPNALAVTVIDPQTLLRPSRIISRSLPHDEPSIRYETPFVSFGQPDPSDPSHFTFEYTCHRLELGPGYSFIAAKTPYARGTIDAYLQDDDTVRFTARLLSASRPLASQPPR